MPSCDARTVLVVEDDLEIRSSLREVLEDEGFGVVTAANGRRALEALAALEPCVILLDLMMPEMDGYQFLEARAVEPRLCGIPVVVVSAFHTGSSPLPGAAEVLTKPVSLDRLLDVVGKYCSPAA